MILVWLHKEQVSRPVLQKCVFRSIKYWCLKTTYTHKFSILNSNFFGVLSSVTLTGRSPRGRSGCAEKRHNGPLAGRCLPIMLWEPVGSGSEGWIWPDAYRLMKSFSFHCVLNEIRSSALLERTPLLKWDRECAPRNGWPRGIGGEREFQRKRALF